MTTIGDKKERYLWCIVTGSETQQENFEDVYLELKEEILKIDVRDSERDLDEDSRKVEQIYIPKEAPQKKILNLTENVLGDKKELLGDGYIRSLKKEHCESGNYLSYEHLLAANIAFSKRPILLVGPHGSGKTLKLRYVWHKYIENHQHCSQDACATKKRIRLLFDIMNRNLATASDFYQLVYKDVFYRVQVELKSTFKDKYESFLYECLEKYKKGEKISFISTLLYLKLSETNTPDFEYFLTGARTQMEYEDLSTFALVFCGWVHNRYCPSNKTCFYLVFDNIDGAAPEVQRAIISLMEKNEIKLSIICACRPETLKNWKDDAIPLFTVPHIGPTAYQVVMNRIERFIRSADKVKLTDLLKNIIEPEVYINNLSLIYKTITSKLGAKHFESLFQNLFGCQIRQGLRFAQGIIDAAASRDTQSLQSIIEEKSFYALERILFRPWGLKSHKLRIVNIYQPLSIMKFRLSALRILIFLSRESEKKIEEICQHAVMFGYSNLETLSIIESLIKNRLILAATKEFPKLESFDECKSEKVNLTETGEGILRQWYQLSYLETTMYYCKSNEDNYPSVKKDPDDSGLKTTFKVLRLFLKESFEIELSELKTVKSKQQIDTYLYYYKGKSIVLDILCELLKTLSRIWCATVKKQQYYHSSISSFLVEIAKDFESDIYTIYDRIEKEIGIKPPFEEDLQESIEFFKKAGSE